MARLAIYNSITMYRAMYSVLVMQRQASAARGREPTAHRRFASPMATKFKAQGAMSRGEWNPGYARHDCPVVEGDFNPRISEIKLWSIFPYTWRMVVFLYALKRR